MNSINSILLAFSSLVLLFIFVKYSDIIQVDSSDLLAVATPASPAYKTKGQWNQKLTVTIDTPSGVVSGSSTVRVDYAHGQGPLSATEVHYEITGEATIIDLGGDRYLFALLGSGVATAERLFRVLGHGHTERGDKLKNIASLTGINRELAVDNYPILVTFENLSDPTSVRLVDPEKLSESFGEGFSLQSISLEVTNDPVSPGKVERLFGWWDLYENLQLDGSRYENLATDHRLANSLNRLNFQMSF